VREEGDTRIGDATVHWRRDGDGPAIVFLHGFPLSGATWDAVVGRLRDRYTCWAPDLIGLGASRSTTDADYASPGQARLFRALLSELGVESYALVGNDTGGWIARELALLDRERVTHLALTNTEIPGHRPPWIPLYQWLAPLPGSSVVFRWMIASRALRRSPMGFGGCFVHLDLLDGEFGDLFVAPLVASSDRVAALAQFLVQMKFARLDRFRELHRELAMPVAFFWGAADPTFPLERARAMTSQFRNVAGFHPIADAKLFVQEEQPEAVARLAGDFFATAS